MKILAIGSRGQLGWELSKQEKHSNFEILAVDLPELDITNTAQIENIFALFKPSIVINAAAYTNVDKAETDHGLAFAVNKDGPANLAKVCAKTNAPLIHISTDFVFDGNRTVPYNELDPVSPLSIYGKSKADGENEVRIQLKEHIILRTSWLYGIHGHNFVKNMLRLGREKKFIKVVDDQYGSPTCAADLSETIWAVVSYIRNGSEVDWGTYHYCGEGITTWYRFAVEIFETASRYGLIKTPKIIPITTAEYPTPAKRPAFSALACRLIKNKFGINTKPWQESLKITIERIMSSSEGHFSDFSRNYQF